ncbi:MAG: dockerin type I domain-containing protein [Oscillospiraceae bacterium]|nr:dockerin type I domain-containing protein [Oscillospiraceae bacterium]
MQSTSSAFDTAIGSSSREIHDKLIIQTADLETYNLTSDDIIAGTLKVNRSCFLEGFEFGTCFAADMSVSLKNLNGEWDGIDLEGATVWPYSGIRLPDTTIEYILLGTFIIDEPGRPDAELSIKAVDLLVLLDKPFSGVSISWPATNYQILQAISTHCSVPLAASVLGALHMDYSVTAAPEGDYSCRDIVEQICLMAAGFGRMSRIGEFEIETLPNIPDSPMLENLITNGDFSAGTTGWTSSAASNSVSNKIMSSTATGAQKYGIFYNKIANRFSASAGDRIYARIKWRLTNDRGVNLYARLVSSTPSATINIFPSLGAPVKDQWYVRSGIAECPVTSTSIGLYVYQYYASTDDATGGTLEIDGNYGVMAINLTDLETALGREVTESEMNGWIESQDGWFGSGDPRVWGPFDVNLLSSHRFSFRQTSEPVTLTGLTYKDAQETVQLGTEDYALQVDRIAILQDDRDTVLAAIWSAIEGYTYTGIEVDYPGNPAIDVGDSIRNLTKDGREVISMISGHTYTHGGSCVLSAAVKPKLATEYISQNTKRLTSVAQKIDTTVTTLSRFQQASAQLSDLLTIGLGLYRTEEPLEDGSVIQYMHNLPERSESDIIWKQTAHAWAYSNDGGDTWQGYDVNGNMVAKILSVVGINAEWINAETLSAISANLGTITAGLLKSSDAKFEINLANKAIKMESVVNGKGVKVEISPSNPFKLSMIGVTSYQNHIYITDASGWSGANILVTSKYDINEDGVVDEEDLKIIIKYILHEDYTPGVAWPNGFPAFARMDVNNDGNVNSADLNAVLQRAMTMDHISYNGGSEQLGIDATGLWRSSDWGATKKYTPQRGWGYFAGNGTADVVGSGISFPNAFPSGVVPRINVTAYGGKKISDGAPASVADMSSTTPYYYTIIAVSNTGFTPRFYRPNSNFLSTYNYVFSWEVELP